MKKKDLTSGYESFRCIFILNSSFEREKKNTLQLYVNGHLTYLIFRFFANFVCAVCRWIGSSRRGKQWIYVYGISNLNILKHLKNCIFRYKLWPDYRLPENGNKWQAMSKIQCIQLKGNKKFQRISCCVYICIQNFEFRMRIKSPVIYKTFHSIKLFHRSLSSFGKYVKKTFDSKFRSIHLVWFVCAETFPITE